MTLDYRWYKPDIEARLKPEMREVYANWSGLTGDELIEHLHKVRDRAWPHGKYPCIGQWHFLQRSIAGFPQFESIVDRVRAGASVLDVGCCFGQDLRLLASRGAPTHNMFAMDITRDLWELGYDLFLDRHKMKAEFTQADIFEDGDRLKKFEGRFDVVIAAQFLHLWSWEKQLEAMKKCVGFCRPGSLLIGYQRGQSKAQTVERDWATMFIHDAESYRRIWRQVEQETGTKWRIDFTMVDLIEWGLEVEDTEWMPPGCMFINFVCQREQ